MGPKMNPGRFQLDLLSPSRWRLAAHMGLAIREE